METDIQPLQEKSETKNSTGCLGELGWFASGSVLPLVSLTFLRKASQRRVSLAILFFFSFTLIITLLSTVGLGVSMGVVTKDIRQAFEDGTFPEIIIRDGVAEVDSPQPIILFDGDTGSDVVFFAIDTTGKIKGIDRYNYTQAVLLTRTDLHFYSDGQYQVLPLAELHSALEKNPIVINAETVTNAWMIFSIGFTVIAFIFIFLWHAIIRLMVLALYALVMWGFVSLIRPNTKFDPIIISALYAIVPAIYLTYLFSRIGISFPGLQTFFLFPFWIAAMLASLSSAKIFSAERPLRLWTALIGLPMLVVFCIDKLSEFPSPYGPAILWGVTILTVLILAGLRLFFRFREQQASGPIQG
jgi:hypothetical protein